MGEISFLDELSLLYVLLESCADKQAQVQTAAEFKFTWEIILFLFFASWKLTWLLVKLQHWAAAGAD